MTGGLCYSAEAMQTMLAGISIPLIFAAFSACFVGGFAGRAAWYFLHAFVLRRLPSWRRFQRALSKVFA